MTTLGEHTSASGGAWLNAGAIVAHRDDQLPGVIMEVDGDVYWVASIYDDDGVPVRAIRRGWLVPHEPDDLEVGLAAIIREASASHVASVLHGIYGNTVESPEMRGYR